MSDQAKTPKTKVASGILALLREQNQASSLRYLPPFNPNEGPLSDTNVAAAVQRDWKWDALGGYYVDECGPIADRTGRYFSADEANKLRAFKRS